MVSPTLHCPYNQNVLMLQILQQRMGKRVNVPYHKAVALHLQCHLIHQAHVISQNVVEERAV